VHLTADDATFAQDLKALPARLELAEAALREANASIALQTEAAHSYRTALERAEAGLAQLSEEHRAELSRRDLDCQALERRCREAGERQAALETALREAESSLKRQVETYEAASSQWDLARLELERKLQASEEHYQLALMTAAREAESCIARLSEENRVTATNLEAARQELDRIKADFAETERRYQRLSQFGSAGFLLAQPDGSVLRCNDAAARMFGYPDADEAMRAAGGFRIFSFEGPLRERLLRDGKFESIAWASLGCDGRLVYLQENAVLIKAPDGSPLVERILTDISRIRRLSDEIRRVRRMESSGDLATATVKSLRDLCASVLHCGERLMEKPADEQTLKSVTESLLSDATRGIKHARQFLSIAEKPEQVPAPFDIRAMLVKNEELLRSLVGGEIELQTVLPNRPVLVCADPVEMIQLISTLVVNSRETLPLGGTLTIESANLEIDPAGSAAADGLQAGIYVLMTVTADGCTVQPERRTASLRLAVERIGGCLETIHTPQTGNVYRIYLPRVEVFPGEAGPPQSAAGFPTVER